MNLDLAPDDIAFVAEVRRDSLLMRANHVRSQQALQSRGGLASGWPVEHGGPGWSPRRRFVFEREIARAGIAEMTPMALIYLGLIVAAFGTPEQQAQWLPAILSTREMWAQGYSTPEAGSDLAALRATAAATSADHRGSMLDDPAFSQALAQPEIRLDAFECSMLRALKGTASRAGISILKIAAAKLAQHLTQLLIMLGRRQSLRLPIAQPLNGRLKSIRAISLRPENGMLPPRLGADNLWRRDRNSKNHCMAQTREIWRRKA